MFLEILNQSQKISMIRALIGKIATFEPLVPMQIRTAASKRKLSKKEYFVYKPRMKSRYRGNPNPLLTMILTEDVENIGFKGDVVKVKRGVGRWKLIPNKLAIYGTYENLIAHGYDPEDVKNDSNVTVPMNVVGYLKKQTINLTVPNNEDAHSDTKDIWFITRHDIAEYFWRHSHCHVPVNNITIKDVSDNLIRSAGSYTAEITLNNSMTIPIALNVNEPVEELD